LKVLFSCAVGYGPFHSQVPVARALAGAGHEVAFATGASFCKWIARVGFPAYPVGLDAPALLQEVARRYPQWPTAVPPEELLHFYLTNTAARVATPRAIVDLIAIVRHWRPQVIVHDPAEFAAPIAAAVGRIPSVNHGWGPLLPLEYYRETAGILAPLWERCRLAPAEMAGMFRHLFLDICPPTLQSPEINEIGPVKLVRPVPVHLRLGNRPERIGSLPDWIDDLGDRPTAYVTLGTIFNNAPGLQAAILDGLEDQGVNVVLVLGSNGDESLLDRRSPTVRVERFVPQSLVLRRCDVVVSHGGAGTILASLDAGLPLLLLPIGIDQFHNARRCADAGVGRWLSTSDRSPGEIGRQVRALLDDPQYRRQAGAVRDEILAMPAPDTAVGALEAVAAAPV
jgi:UDP:flavonoid glycosyltransferase YjiC (YdhE family)